MPKIREIRIPNNLCSYAETILSNSYQLIQYPIVKIMSYQDLQKTGKNSAAIKILGVLFLWVSLRFLTVFTCCKTACLWFIRGCSNFCALIFKNLKTGCKKQMTLRVLFKYFYQIYHRFLK